MKISNTFVIAAACLVVGCSAGGSAGEQQTRPAKTPVPTPSQTGEAACFYGGQVQNFLVLDRSNIIVYAPSDRHAYHIQISPPSVEVLHVDALVFERDRICGFAGDRMVVAGAATGRRFSVIAVSRLSPESLEILRSGGKSGQQSEKTGEKVGEQGRSP